MEITSKSYLSLLQIVRDLGGYSFGRSDLVRRAMSKKKMSVMLEEKEYFINGKTDAEGSVEIAGCVRNGVPAEAAEVIFEDMVSFASYAFNKSHAAAYAVLSYQTAYLKCHYPAEFMAALMSSMAGDVRHTSDYVRNCRELGIALDPPSVLRSRKNYSVNGGRIRFGLRSVKNVGDGIIDAIIEGRKSVGITHDIYEFIDAIDASELNKKAIESLVRAGAFDEINPNRAKLMAVCDDCVQRAQKRAKQGNRDQISLFQLDEFAGESLPAPELPKVADFDRKTKLSLEKEMLGVYLSGHPLDEYASVIRQYTTAGTSELTGGSEEFTAEGDDADSMVINTSKFKNDDRVVVAGMISAVRTMVTRKSQEMARITLEDFDGVIDVIIFPKVYERKRNLVRPDVIVGLSGRVSFKEDSNAEILAEDIVPIESIEELSRRNQRHGRNLRSGSASDGAYGENNSYIENSGYGDGFGYSETYGEAPYYEASSGIAGQPPGPAGPSMYPAGPSAGPQRRQQPSRDMSAPVNPVKLRVPQSVIDVHGSPRKVLLHLTDMMSLYPGGRDVLVYLPGRKPARCSSDKRITLTEELRSRLIRLLGSENVKG